MPKILFDGDKTPQIFESHIPHDMDISEHAYLLSVSADKHQSWSMAMFEGKAEFVMWANIPTGMVPAIHRAYAILLT
jgi:deoxyribodipyrimidine photolyase-like uncharacterized protein